MQEKLLLYYKMTGVELIRPMRLDGETFDQAKDRVLKETAVLDSDRKADLLKQYAKELKRLAPQILAFFLKKCLKQLWLAEN